MYKTLQARGNKLQLIDNRWMFQEMQIRNKWSLTSFNAIFLSVFIKILKLGYIKSPTLHNEQHQVFGMLGKPYISFDWIFQWNVDFLYTHLL